MPRSFLAFTCCEIDSSNQDILEMALKEIAKKYPNAIVEAPEVSVDRAAGMSVVGLKVDLDVGTMFAFQSDFSAVLQRCGLLLMET